MDYISDDVLSQYDNNKILYLIGYFSKKHLLVESNYEIYDKKLIAIIRVFEKWYPKLKRSKSFINVISDYKNFEYFSNSK